MATESDLLRAAVHTLYALDPAEFVRERTRLVTAARRAGDREAATAIGALRRPTAGAAALNALVHRGHPVMTELRELGARLRLAQAGLDAAGLAALRAPRDALLTAVVQAVADGAGGVPASVQAGLRDSVIAALADEEAQEVLCSGALTRTLSYSGFGEVDLSDAVARTSTGVLLTRLEGGRTEVATPASTPGAAGNPPDPREAASDGPVPTRGVTAPAVTVPTPGTDVDAHPDPEKVAAAQDAVRTAHRELRRTAAAVAQARRLLEQALRREDAARAASEQAERDLADLTG